MKTQAEATEQAASPPPDLSHHPGRITAGELVLVCSHYDLGVIKRVQKFPGGSRNSPKVLLVSDTAAYLLKRRAPGAPSDPRTVALTHEIILHLEGRGIPAPELVGTRRDNNSMLQLPGTGARGRGGDPSPGRVYEVYRFVRGRSYARSPADSTAAGSMLARVHAELGDFRSQWPIPRGTYHAHDQVARMLGELAQRRHDLGATCRSLAALYRSSWEASDRTGLGSLPITLVHSDWHPGNIVYRKDGAKIAAILDFDSARLSPLVADAANGAMQFSLGKHTITTTTQTDASREWSITLNPDLYAAFWRGYNRAAIASGRNAEALGDPRIIPRLMIESLIVEALVPIAATGRFDSLDAGPVLRMVERASIGIAQNADRLAALSRTS